MVEATVFNLLKSLVGNRAFPMVAPGETALPYMTYQRIGGEAINTIGRDFPDKANAFIQVSIWAATRAECSTLAAQVEQLFLTSDTFNAADSLSAPVDMYENDTGIHGSILRFSVWYSR